MRAHLVLPLCARAASDPALAGDKAAGLNLLLRHGFPVPPGFCLLPAAAVNPAAPTLRGLPPDFYRAVSHAYGHLGALVAVRSSPVGAAPGGRSIIGVNGEEATARAAARCMTECCDGGSPATARARLVGSVGPSRLCPVIVQRLVDAIASGVATTNNPLTGDEMEIMIHAQWGIGQTAQTKPDLFRLRKYPLLLLAKEAGTKVQEVRAGPVGIVRRPLSKDHRAILSLTDAQALCLARLIRRVEERVGFPVEVEWALTARGFYLLQLRDAPVPSEDCFYLTPAVAGGEGECLRFFNALEIPTGVISPLNWDLFSRGGQTLWESLLGLAGLRQVAKIRPLVLVAGRIYLNLTGITKALEEARVLAPGASTRYAVSHLATGQVSTRHRQDIPLFRLSLHFLPHLSAILRYRRRLELEQVQQALTRIADECGRLDRVFTEDLTPAQLAVLLGTIEAFLQKHLDVLVAAHLESRRFLRLMRYLRRSCGPGSEVAGAKLVAGLGTLDSAFPGYVLWELAHLIKTEIGVLPAEPEAFLAALTESESGRQIAEAIASFQSTHGYHGRGEFDLAVPRWGDDVALVVKELQAFLQLHEAETPDEHRRQQEAARSESVAWVDIRLSSGWRRAFFWRRRKVWALHARLLRSYPLHENAKAALLKIVWHYRRFILRAGRELAHRTLLAQPEEVFLLRADEIRAALVGEADMEALRARMVRRASAQAEYSTLEPPPTIQGLYRLSEFTAPPPDRTGRLTGLGVSPGRVHGTARLVRTRAEVERFLPGEILIAANPDYGWAPLLLRARAVVTMLGGWRSAAAVMAREYGVPAVVGVAHVFSSIHDGAMLEVDGSRGRVEVLATEAPQSNLDPEPAQALSAPDPAMPPAG